MHLKDSAWACLLGKNDAFLETPETRFLAITLVSGALQYIPKACPVEFYGLECWGWAVVAATAEVNPNACNIHTGLKHLFQWDQLKVCQTHSKSVQPHLTE